MRNVADIHGLHLMAEFTMIGHVNSPGSGIEFTIPPNKLSHVIDSYINRPDGDYFVLEREKEIKWKYGFPVPDESVENIYVKDVEGIRVVDDQEPEDGTFLETAFARVLDAAGNAGRDAKKKAGFLSEGFRESVRDLKITGLSFSGELKNVIYAITGLLAVVVIISIINR